MVFIPQTGVAAVTGELELELRLIGWHGHAAYPAFGADPWPSQEHAGRGASWELPISDCCPSLFSERVFVHLADPTPAPRDGAATGKGKARCHWGLAPATPRPDTRWKATPSLARSAGGQAGIARRVSE
jgi:hypothetical protein